MAGNPARQNLYRKISRNLSHAQLSTIRVLVNHARILPKGVVLKAKGYIPDCVRNARIVPEGFAQKANAHQIFNQLEKGGNSKLGNLSILADILRTIGRHDYAEQAEKIAENERKELTKAEVWAKRPRDKVDVSKYFHIVISKVSYKWKDLARTLGFTRNEIKAIETKERHTNRTCREMLERWREREGEAATLQALKMALISIEERLTAESLEDDDDQQRSTMSEQKPEGHMDGLNFFHSHGWRVLLDGKPLTAPPAASTISTVANIRKWVRSFNYSDTGEVTIMDRRIRYNTSMRIESFQMFYYCEARDMDSGTSDNSRTSKHQSRQEAAEHAIEHLLHRLRDKGILLSSEEDGQKRSSISGQTTEETMDKDHYIHTVMILGDLDMLGNLLTEVRVEDDSRTNTYNRLARHVAESGLTFRAEVPKDGNCMFHAVVDQLFRTEGRRISHVELRKQVVDFLRQNPHNAKGDHFSDFLSDQNWEQYLETMSHDGTWGDHIVLQAIADMFGHDVSIVSSVEAAKYVTILTPNIETVSRKEPPLLLGHYAENHYASLDASVPLEVQLGGPELRALYDRACKEGTIEMYSTRFVLIGKFGNGKTNLCNSLLGDDFDPEWKITDGIAIHPCVMTQEQQWTELEDQGDHLPQAIANAMKELKGKEQQEDPNTKGQTEPDVSDTTHRDMTSHERRASETLPPELKRPQLTVDEKPIAENPPEAYPEAVKIFHKKEDHTNVTGTEEYPQISIWDFGGHEIFYSTQQVFYTRRAIYGMTMDLTKPLENLVEKTTAGPTSHCRTERDFLDYHLESIRAHTRPSRPHSIPGTTDFQPPVLFIFTHKDELERIAANYKEAERIFHDGVRAHLKKQKHIDKHVIDEYFSVDNTKRNPEDPEMAKLRKSILDLAKQQSYMGEEIPIKWLELKSKLQDMHKEGKRYCSLQQVMEVIGSPPEEVTPEDNAISILTFWHLCGDIIYFPEIENLRDFVILDPQWFVDVCKTIITIPQYRDREVKEEWDKLQETGELQDHLIEHVWTHRQEAVKYKLFHHKQELLGIMEKFDLVLRCHGRVDEETGPKYDRAEQATYFVPALLTTVTDVKRLYPSSTICSKPIFIRFDGEFCPVGLYHRLVVNSMRRYNRKKPLAFASCARFITSNSQQTFIVTKETFYLKIELVSSVQDEASRFSHGPGVRAGLDEDLKEIIDKWAPGIKWHDWCLRCCCDDHRTKEDVDRFLPIAEATATEGFKNGNVVCEDYQPATTSVYDIGLADWFHDPRTERADKRSSAHQRIQTSETFQKLKHLLTEMRVEDDSRTDTYTRLARHVVQSGLTFRDEVPKDGNCMFHAVADQLFRTEGRRVSHGELRKQVVDYLRQNPHNGNGDHFSDFVPDQNWAEYLDTMSRDGTWGDHIVLQAMADMFGHDVSIVSSIDEDNYVTILTPSTGTVGRKEPPLLLGHYAENHYASLDGKTRKRSAGIVRSPDQEKPAAAKRRKHHPSAKQEEGGFGQNANVTPATKKRPIAKVQAMFLSAAPSGIYLSDHSDDSEEAPSEITSVQPTASAQPTSPTEEAPPDIRSSESSDDSDDFVSVSPV